MYSLPDLIRWRALVSPDVPAIWYDGREQTYRELDRRASQAANALIARGVQPGDRIAVLDMNSDMQIELIFGIAKAAAVLVPVNWRLAPPEMRFIIDDAEAKLLFVGGPFCAMIEPIEKELKSVRQVIAFDGGPERWEQYTAIRDAAPGTDPMIPINASDTCWQAYTSGTTGTPKGAEIMTCNLLPPYLGALSWLELRAGDVMLVAMPLFHVTGSAWALLGVICGATLVVLREFNPAKVLLAVQAHKVNHMVLVPAAMNFVLQAGAQLNPDLSSLKSVLYAASPIPEELLRRAMAFFKCQFVQAYGLTETAGAVAILPARDHQLSGPHTERLKSAGQPILGMDVRVVDADGNDCAPGAMGEIIMRGPLLMRGYWKNPEATAQAIRGGWFHSGDAGSMDADGYIYVRDRIKDMIISGGENIYPAEVENVLYSHPAVADAAVIGVPDERWGETVKAIVVLKAGASATAEDIIQFCNGRIGGYKRPTSVEFVTVLPRNPTGKVLKRELRKPYWEGQARAVN